MKGSRQSSQILTQSFAYEPDRTPSSSSILVRLPDGTRMEKTAKSLLIVGPTGQSLELSPPPPWSCPTHVQRDSIEYIEKFGKLQKLSKERDFFNGEKWQERHFVLSGTQLFYYGSAAEREPRGVIPLENCYIGIKKKGEPRRKDAFQVYLSSCMPQGDSAYDGIITRTSIALHKPPAAKKTDKSLKDMARTYYFNCSDEHELLEWYHAIENNINSSSTEKSLLIFDEYVASVSGSTDGYDFIAILNRLYGQY